MTKLRFIVDIEAEGTITRGKLDRITETLESSLRAVAMPNEELKVAAPSHTYTKGWHEHKPEDDGESCSVCKRYAVVAVAGE